MQEYVEHETVKMTLQPELDEEIEETRDATEEESRYHEMMKE